MTGRYFLLLGVIIVIILFLNIFFLYIPITTISGDLQSTLGTGNSIIATAEALVNAPSIVEYTQCMKSANNVVGTVNQLAIKQQCEAALVQGLISDLGIVGERTIQCLNCPNPTGDIPFIGCFQDNPETFCPSIPPLTDGEADTSVVGSSRILSTLNNLTNSLSTSSSSTNGKSCNSTTSSSTSSSTTGKSYNFRKPN